MRAARLPLAVCGAFLLICVARPAHAASILTAAYEAQLETWLGQGNLTFANIFTKATGSTSTDFHSAADGMGATFTLLEAVYQGNTYVIGGYNPQSWSSSGNYNYTVTDAQRTAFIYNLTNGVMQAQRLTTDPYSPWYGQYQTYNHAGYGPTFGGGHDIWINGSLSSGYAYQYSYGSGSPCGYAGSNIFGVVLHTTPCFTGTGASPFFSVTALEVYTFAPTAVPEPASLALLGTGVTGLLARRWRIRRNRTLSR